MSSGDDSGLDLVWTFGFSTWIADSVHDLFPVRPNSLVTIAGLHAVIYNYVAGEQQLLVGHNTMIGAIATSNDRSSIFTAESDGHADGLAIVWESRSGLPQATRSMTQGVASAAFCSNGAAIAMLTNSVSQSVLLWRWAPDVLVQVEMGPTRHPMSHICWNPSSHDLCVTGPGSVAFLYFECDADGAFTFARCDVRRVPTAKHSGLRAHGDLCRSVHVPDSNDVLSGTNTGTVIVWSQLFNQSRRSFLKAVPLGATSPITLIDVVGDLVVVASHDQALRFLDRQFRIMFWVDDFAYGPINSLSFAASGPSATMVRAGVPIHIPEFVLATSQANVVKMTAKSIQAMPHPKQPRGFLLMKGFDDHVVCITTHMTEPVFAAATRSGSFQLVDYVDRTIRFAKQFASDLLVTAMAFASKADHPWLAIALRAPTGSALIQICSLQTRMAVLDQLDAGRNGCVHLVQFSACDSYLASASSETVPGRAGQRHLVYVYGRDHGPDPKWACLGRAEPHSSTIVQIEFERFRREPGRPARLLSLSSDRALAVIDLAHSNPVDGVRVIRTALLDVDSVPVSMHVHHAHPTIFVTVSDACGKIRTFVERERDGEWICVRTANGPVNDEFVAQRLIPLSSTHDWQLDFRDLRKVVNASGPASDRCQCDGNTAVIGQAGRIDQVVAGFDGLTLLVNGGHRQCVSLWRVNLDQFRATMALESAAPSADDRDRIRHVVLHAMLRRARGRGSAAPGDSVEMSEVGEVLRGLGCFVSERDVRQVQTEMRWSSNQTQASLDEVAPEGAISLDALLALWLNYRRLRPDPDMSAIVDAFRVLSGSDSARIPLETLVSKLEDHGERMGQGEFERCFRRIHASDDLAAAIPSTLTPAIFVADVLGLGPSPA